MPVNYLKPLLAKSAPIALEEFAKQTQSDDDDSGPQIERAEYSKTGFPITVYKGCTAKDIGEVVLAIEEAINVGAPLYNQGEIEACFRIYEGTATKLERDAPCTGVRTTFGDGLLRAGSLATYKEKAWAMRDTFDGLLLAARNWASANANAAKQQGVQPGAKPDAKPDPK
jgi:hypothetical protein